MFHSYCNMDFIERVSPICKSATRVALGNQIYAINSYRGNSPYSYIVGRWQSNSNNLIFRPAIIRKIFEVKAFNGESLKPFWVAELDWFREHEMYNNFGHQSK